MLQKIKQMKRTPQIIPLLADVTSVPIAGRALAMRISPNRVKVKDAQCKSPYLVGGILVVSLEIEEFHDKEPPNRRLRFLSKT